MSERFNVNKLNTIINELGTIPRLVGSEGEIKGINYCKKIFKEINLDLKEEEFECVRGWVGSVVQGIFVLASGLIIAMMLLLMYVPWANIIIIIGLLGVFISLIPGITGSKGLKMIGKRYKTKNLFAKIPTKGGKTPKQYILLTAHHDTKSQTLTTMIRGLSYLLLVFGVVLLLLMVLIGIFIDLFSGNQVPQIVKTLGVIFGIIGLCGTILLSLNFLGNKSPGALDNASAIAVIYEIARTIKDQGGLENTELTVAIFGAEEVAMWGSKAFMKMHKNEYPVENTVNINLDMVGLKGSPVQIMETYGIPIKKPISPFMTGLAYRVAKDLNIDLSGYWMPIGASTDGFVIRDFGYDGCEFAVFDAAKRAHHADDSVDMWDGAMGIKNCEIIYGIIDKLDVHGIKKLE